MIYPFTIGLPRLNKEAGERRDFLPDFVALLNRRGAQVVLEHGYGEGMGYTENDYLNLAPESRFATPQEVYQQDYVMLVRYPADEQIEWMKPGSCLISMVHYATRPSRVSYLRSLNLEAISLDSIKDDSGRRLVENLRAVAWNGMEAAFNALRASYPPPGFESSERDPIQVTVMGAGAVGSQVVQAAARYANPQIQKKLSAAGIPGVLVNVLDYDLTGHKKVIKEVFSHTDILVDATQRPDPTVSVIPNDWVAYLPSHAVLLDLSVDPYDCSSDPPYVKGIEGIPQGNLDQYKFEIDDPAYESLPSCVQTLHRRTVVSCYSWPGIYPKKCMEVYGKQIAPIMRILIERGGIQYIHPRGRFFERAITRAQLTRWGKEFPQDATHSQRAHPPEKARVSISRRMTIGFPRMMKEPGELRVFLPEFIQHLAQQGAVVNIEEGYGSRSGLSFADYHQGNDAIRLCSREDAFQQDIVLVLRSPAREEFNMIRPGRTLLSMLHFPTRPVRVQILKNLGIKAISLDSIVNDQDIRLVENMKAVAWNGLEAAFNMLQQRWPDLVKPDRQPLKVLVLGTGMVGKHAVDAATKLGNIERNNQHIAENRIGVVVKSVGRNLTKNVVEIERLFRQADILVDASQRRDATVPVVPNDWIAWLPEHAVISDLSVDPYTMDANPPVVRGVEGIPQGDLNQYIFSHDDANWNETIPEGIPSRNRRAVVSCYSWPGIHPEACMRHYALQLEPLMETLLARGYDGLSPEGDYFERALYRATLKACLQIDHPIIRSR